MPEVSPDSTIYEVIRTAHRIVSSLLEELADTSEDDIARREQLQAAVERELAVHARTEEAVFYDLLLRNQQTRPLVEKAQAEHDTVLRLLSDLDRGHAIGEAWDDMMAELAATVAQHIEEEESELFPAMEQLLDDEQARALAATFQAERAKIEGEERPLVGAVRHTPPRAPEPLPVVPPPPQERRPDESIAEDIREQLAGHPELAASDVEFRVVDGEVTLSGSVDDRVTKFRVEEIVEDVPGVTDVYNLVSVRPAAGTEPAANTSTPSPPQRAGKR